MARFEGPLRDWQQRAERFRQWAALLGKYDNQSRLHALALEMEQNVAKLREMTAAREELMRQRSVLLDEIDTLLARANVGMFYSRHLLRPYRFSAADLREGSRLCREEAMSTEDPAMRRSFTSRAFRLNQLGELTEKIES